MPGYVHAWYKDIGAHVKKGEVLATIDTPELDQQIAQARADLGAAQCGAETVRYHRDRWDSLLPLDAVSKQDAEDKKRIWKARTARSRQPRPILTVCRR